MMPEPKPQKFIMSIPEMSAHCSMLEELGRKAAKRNAAIKEAVIQAYLDEGFTIDELEIIHPVGDPFEFEVRPKNVEESNNESP